MALVKTEGISKGRYITVVPSGARARATFCPVSVIVESRIVRDGYFFLKLLSSGTAAITSPTETA